MAIDLVRSRAPRITLPCGIEIEADSLDLIRPKGRGSLPWDQIDKYVYYRFKRLEGFDGIKDLLASYMGFTMVDLTCGQHTERVRLFFKDEDDLILQCGD